jgi:hypothetical protein
MVRGEAFIVGPGNWFSRTMLFYLFSCPAVGNEKVPKGHPEKSKSKAGIET